MSHLTNRTFEEAKAQLLEIEIEEVAAGLALKLLFPHDGPFGLPSDAVRTTPEYKAARKRWQKAFKALQDFNSVYVKQYAKELKAERDARRKELNERNP